MRSAFNWPLLLAAARVWATEILVSGFNYFVMMMLVWEPLWGERTAHQIGMSTRIVYLFVFAWLLLKYADHYSPRDLWQVGGLWLALALIFEWGGSALINRPVRETTEGWHVLDGYMWPFVLLAYAFAVPIVGTVVRPRRVRPGRRRAPSA